MIVVSTMETFINLDYSIRISAISGASDRIELILA